MAALTISQQIPSVNDLFAKCTPAFGLGNNMCGSVTEMDLSATVASELAAIYADSNGAFRLMGALIESDFMGKACQIKQNSFYDYINATARMWGTKRLTISPTGRDTVEIFPFVKMKRRGIINNNFWNVTSGNGTGGANTPPNGLGPYDYSCVLTSQTGIPADVRWFPANTQIVIRSVTTGGTATTTSWKIIDVAITGTGSSSYATVYCKSLNAGSYLSGPQLTVPTVGLAQRGLTNVNPYESYCAQVPGINANQLALFWVQDTRWSLCVDEHTERYMQLLRDNNPYYREFGDVESIELNRQILQDYQSRMVTQFFWGKPLPNQDQNNYNNLEVIDALGGPNMSNYFYLPNLEGRAISRRANAVGVYEQLAQCGRVLDLQGGVLNLPEFFQNLYIIHRARMDNNIPADMIEVITDMQYAIQLRQALFNYLNDRCGGLLRVNVSLDSVMKGGTTTTGFSYMDYKLDYPAGVTLRVATHMAFDDLLSAQKASTSSTTGQESRMLLILDLGRTIYKSVIETASVNLTTGDIKELALVNEDAFCRMIAPRKRIRHNSEKFTVVVECPLASLWIENIAGTVPEWRGAAGSITSPAGTLPGYSGN